tara:strand:- start:472 stop:645 length:174 start_codon:yes stop_codon:yes gene_type:complete
MEEKHREPWEALSMTAAAYLSLILWHCTITVIDYGVLIMKYREELDLIDCVEIPLLL